MAGKGIYGGDTNLEARVDSLESGDAFGAGDPSDVLTRGDPTPEWAPASGGGADLSAVDEDIVVINEHAVRMQADVGLDPNAQGSVRFDPNNYGVVVEGAPDYAFADLYVQAETNPNRYLNLSVGADPSSPVLTFSRGPGLAVSIRNTAPGMLHVRDTNMSFETRVDSGNDPGAFGPILEASDNSLHRLVVAPDGTLSTVPFTP